VQSHKNDCTFVVLPLDLVLTILLMTTAVDGGDSFAAGIDGYGAESGSRSVLGAETAVIVGIRGHPESLLEFLVEVILLD
jgi:hypothetical protein